jgi:hypothetical protein
MPLKESLIFQRGFEIVFGVKCNKISLLHALQFIKSCQGLDCLFKVISRRIKINNFKENNFILFLVTKIIFKLE